MMPRPTAKELSVSRAKTLWRPVAARHFAGSFQKQKGCPEDSGSFITTQGQKYISSANIASVYSAAGDRERAIGWLQTALAEHDPYLTWIKFDREFDCLRKDARFQDILQKVGLADTGIDGFALSITDLYSTIELT